MNRLKKVCRRALVVCLSLGILWASSIGAEAVESTTYTVIYRPGNIARFSSALYERYREQYGSACIMSEATGSIKITVTGGAPYPEAPSGDLNAGDIILDEAHQGKYYIKTLWMPVQPTVTENGDYVVDYGALANEVEYTIRFVAAIGGADVASPVISVGNVEDKVTYTAKLVDGYAYDTYVKEMTLSGDSAENEIQFHYNNTEQAQPTAKVVEIPGDTITNYIYEERANATVHESTPVQTENSEPTEDTEGTGELEEAEEMEETVETRKVEEEEVPLANNIAKEQSGLSVPAVLGSIFAGVLLVAAGIIYYLKKCKKA